MGQRSVGRPKKRFIDHIKGNLLKRNIKPSNLEALASDRDIWRTVCDTGLRRFLNGWITTSEERRHTASTKPKSTMSSVQQISPPISDSEVTCGPMTRPATLSSSATSSSSSTDFSSSSSSILQYKVSLLLIDLVVAFVLSIFMLVYCCVSLYCYRFTVNKDLYKFNSNQCQSLLCLLYTSPSPRD